METRVTNIEKSGEYHHCEICGEMSKWLIADPTGKTYYCQEHAPEGVE